MSIVNAIDAGALIQMYRQGVADRQAMQDRQIALEDRRYAMEDKARAREQDAQRRAVMGRLFSMGEPSTAIDESGAVSQPSYAPTAVTPESAPVDHGRLFDITAHSESRNRDYANGAPVRSPKGALYAMQVMPGTNRDPGFGVRAAADGSPEESNRVGRDYLLAMRERYGGDMEKAWAAYNWGPGNLDRALQTHGENWLQAAPAETRNYVAKNMAALGEGGQAPNAPQQSDEPVQLSSLSAPSAHPAYNKDAMRDLMVIDPELAMRLHDHFSKADEADRKQFETKNTALGQAAQYLSGFPQAQRGQALRAVSRQLVAAGWTPQELQQADLSDNGLKGYVAMAIDVDKLMTNARADAQFEETKRHNRASEETARGNLGLSRDREARIKQWGPQPLIGVMGNVPSTTDDLNY